ncbi:MAG TPA: bifunctional diaminohydroxyphosphoribosylaminopyrimidine deaminase/5-amino-6-(5-phosphoribosylamino)uracil reductase RibD [Solirubrobacterales bacterium]|jgi:diaminohydroxyphosphoribosylaminopyrimidine deaminase/5-amino-6-(5-phosphoribosylamino)uracil reductase
MNAELTATDRAHLERALALAEGGRGRVSPNPLVGAVVVRDGETIGEGFHAALGDLHAERAALEDCRSRGEDPAGATMYVSLEPCAHHGRQPPCTDAILEAGVARVVIGSDDPSEKAAGRGPGILRDGGVEVEVAAGPEATAARLLNQPFRKHARTGIPLVTLKLAMSVDGATATAPGDSRWISGERSRELVHRWRAESDAIAVGIGTVLADDPQLTARHGDNSRQPLRVVFDSAARLPRDSRLISTLDVSPVLVVASPVAASARMEALKGAGAEIIIAGGATSTDRIHSALSELGRRNITSLLLEGGPKLADAFTTADAIDEVRVFVAPILLGNAAPRVGGVGEGGIEDEPARSATPSPTTGPARRVALSTDVESIEDDLLIKCRFREW